MANILTPLSLWGNFDCSLDTNSETISAETSEGVKIEKVNFYGRDTGNGRVRIAAVFACDAYIPATETVIIFPDSTETFDYKLLKMFVKQGYSALMVDYRGIWKDCDFYTQYPKNIEFANTALCGRYKDYVDESADKTCWYEWVAIGLYAKKFVIEKTGEYNIAVVGIRDGGEIAWKLGVAADLSCIVPVCAAGWKAYAGVRKYASEEPKMDDERYRFIAGIDSQAYAPSVKCPVMMLCSTNDNRFDYDRAYDTFSRINPQFIDKSAISYSVICNETIDGKSISGMFMFLDRNLKSRQVFIPKPAVITVEADEEQNLIAKAIFDVHGIVESCKVYLAEDCADSSIREWKECSEKRNVSDSEREFYLNIYEKTATIFVLGCVTYSNGFTVWSKTCVKKISGKFRNMHNKGRLIYSNNCGVAGFVMANPKSSALGGVFIDDESVLPKTVEKSKGIKGVFSPCGISTFRFTSPCYAPFAGSVLSIDVYCDTTQKIGLSLLDLITGEVYNYSPEIIGGVWQSIVCESALFKNAVGVPLEAYTQNLKFTVSGEAPFAVNNLSWL